LSGGQRQRLAIARAIIKQPTILLLDEATSSIDVNSEQIVQAALDRVSQNRTTITIAHRLSTIIKADKIVVLRKAKVVEQGTHEELRDASGVYHGLVHAQNLSMGSPIPDTVVAKTAENSTIDAQVQVSESKAVKSETEEYKPRGIVGSFGLLLYEQRHKKILYVFIILSAMGCAGKPWLVL
jgi:ATP-binding cassette subfamily B (MDR/TAP) protein 1